MEDDGIIIKCGRDSMKSDQTASPDELALKTSSLSNNKSALMAPPASGFLTSINKHKRAGSTGTTGDESCTTDEEDNVEQDEPDCSIKDHVTGKLFGSYSDVGSEKAMHR